MIQSQPSTGKTALAPDPQRLSERGQRAWTEEMAIRPLGDEYVVDSQSGMTYIVDLQEGSCTCPDQTIRGLTCKHLRRVAIEITLGRLSPPGMVSADCVACGRPTWVERDGTDLPFCRACRFEPGETVIDRNTGDRLVVTGLSGTPANEITLAATGNTVAAHPTNEGYPADDPVIEVVYARALDRENEPRRYLFPHSRLESSDRPDATR